MLASLTADRGRDGAPGLRLRAVAAVVPVLDMDTKGQDMSTETTGVPDEPLSKLDENGEASILNYNLPQSTAYDVVSFIQLDIDPKFFKPEYRQAPKNTYWDQLDAERKNDNLNLQDITNIVAGTAYTPIKELQDVGLNLNARTEATRSGVYFKAANIPVASKSVESSASYIANRIDQGDRPVLYKRPSGKQGLRFAPRPARPTPSIFMTMHMRMASYLGDYGAGQTLSTFSLLPGEKTVIEIRDYQHNEEVSTSAESVLDSYSESSMDDLQTTIEESTEQNESSSETDTDSMSADLSVNGGVNLGIVKLGADASGSASSVNTTTEAVSSQVNTLTSAVDHHVQTADSLRQVEVNTSTTSTAVSETEQTTTRTLENINRSRVLNFTYRQMSQEYYTLTYLNDVSFVFTNGYPNSKKTGTLSSMQNLLSELLVDAKAVEEVSNRIYEHLCNIPDHTGTRVSFIEQVTEKSANCINPKASPTEVRYVRKRQDLVQAYKDKSVKGIILDVTHRILRTPAVIVDALLSGGFALDVYNQRLQEAAYVAAELNNEKTEQAMGIIESITDPAEKAALYKKVFGDCCDTPQSDTDAGK